MSSPLQRALPDSAVALAPRGLRISAVAFVPRGLRISAVAFVPRGLRLAYVPPVFDQYRFQRVSLDFVATQQAPLPPCPALVSIKDLLRTHRRRGFIRAFEESSLRRYVASMAGSSIAPLRHDDCGGPHWYGGACPLCSQSPASSYSIRSSSSAGRPAAIARSKAGANSAVRVTTSPNAPNASA